MVSQSQCRMARFQLATFPDSLDCVEYFYLFFWPPDDRCHVPGCRFHRCNAALTPATKLCHPPSRKVTPISLAGLVWVLNVKFRDGAFLPRVPKLALTSFSWPDLLPFSRGNGHCQRLSKMQSLTFYSSTLLCWRLWEKQSKKKKKRGKLPLDSFNLY